MPDLEAIKGEFEALRPVMNERVCRPWAMTAAREGRTPPWHGDSSLSGVVTPIHVGRPGRGCVLKEYPSIPSATELLARRPEYMGRPFVAFEKLDGSNVRAEWDRKRGWHLFGSRHRPLDASHPQLGGAVGLILDGYGDGLAKALVDDPAILGAKQATAYFEYLGPHSFAGMHDPAELGVPSNGPMRVVLIDLNLHKRGLVDAETFIARLGHLGVPRVAHRGVLTPEFIADVRAGVYGTGEGVILKGGEGHGRWMAKAKTDAYLRRLKESFQADWGRHWE